MENNLLLDEGFNEKKLDNNTDIAEANQIRRSINETTKAINNGKYAIIMAIVFLTIGSVIEVVAEPYLLYYSAVAYVIIVALYGVGLYLLKEKPVAGLTVGLVVYILFLALTIIGDPDAYKGFIVKGIIIYYISKGIIEAKKLPQKIEELKGLSFNETDREKIKSGKELPKIHYLKQNQTTV